MTRRKTIPPQEDVPENEAAGSTDPIRQPIFKKLARVAKERYHPIAEALKREAGASVPRSTNFLVWEERFTGLAVVGLGRRLLFAGDGQPART